MLNKESVEEIFMSQDDIFENKAHSELEISKAAHKTVYGFIQVYNNGNVNSKFNKDNPKRLFKVRNMISDAFYESTYKLTEDDMPLSYKNISHKFFHEISSLSNIVVSDVLIDSDKNLLIDNIHTDLFSSEDYLNLSRNFFLFRIDYSLKDTDAVCIQLVNIKELLSIILSAGKGIDIT